MFNYIRDNENLFRYSFNYDAEALFEFINTMIRANHYAVNHRYSERSRSFKLTQADVNKYAMLPISSFQMLKSLGCTKYQMSEGDTDKKFKKLFDKMYKLEADIACGIIDEMPQYAAAVWGI